MPLPSVVTQVIGIIAYSAPGAPPTDIEGVRRVQNRMSEQPNNPPPSGGFYGGPRVPSFLIPRPELIEELSAASPLTVVRGPGGSGKTVLLAEWASLRDPTAPPGVWVTAHEGAATRLAFWREVVLTIVDAGYAEHAPVFGRLVAEMRITDDPRHLLVRGFGQLRTPLVVVIDDYQHVSDDDVHDDIVFLLQHCPNLEFVISTRTLSPLELPVTSLSLDTVVIDPSTLRFTLSETATAFEQADFTCWENLALAAHDLSDGSAIAIRGLIVALQMEPDGLDAPEISPRLIDASATMLHDSVVGRLSPDTLQVAMRCSVADVLALDLVVDLANLPDLAAAETALSQLEAAGIGMWAVSTLGRTFQISELVRSMLRTELRNRSPELVDGLVRRAAEWALENDQPFVALREAVSISDLDLATRVAQARWFTLLSYHPMPWCGSCHRSRSGGCTTTRSSRWCSLWRTTRQARTACARWRCSPSPTRPPSSAAPKQGLPSVSSS